MEKKEVEAKAKSQFNVYTVKFTYHCHYQYFFWSIVTVRRAEMARETKSAHQRLGALFTVPGFEKYAPEDWGRYGPGKCRDLQDYFNWW